MYRNILKDAEEVKRRLSSLGLVENVNVDVICEILQSSGSEYKLDDVVDLITVAREPNISNVSNESDTLIINHKLPFECSSPHHSTDQVPGTENAQYFVEEMYVEDLSDVSSDSCDGDYYTSGTLDDISVIDTVRSPLVGSYDDVALPKYETTAIPELEEVLEENNNDPNNNLDSVQMLHEIQNNSPEANCEVRSPNVEFGTEVVEEPESPKPGCSKDLQDTHHVPVINFKLRMEMGQISTLLPNIEQIVILETLLRNSNAKNRTELTLWDLLSEERPKAQLKQQHEVVKSSKLIHSKKQIINKKAEVLDQTQKKQKKKRPITEEVVVESMDNQPSINQEDCPIIKAKVSKLDNSTSSMDANDTHEIKMLVSSIVEDVFLKDSAPDIAVSNLMSQYNPAASNNISKGHSTPIIGKTMPESIRKLETIQLNLTKMLSKTSQLHKQLQEQLTKMNSQIERTDKSKECEGVNTSSANVPGNTKNKRAFGAYVDQSQSFVSSTDEITVLENKPLSNVELAKPGTSRDTSISWVTPLPEVPLPTHSAINRDPSTPQVCK